MDETIINLMLRNLDGSLEDCESNKKMDSIIELIDIRCEGDCNLKVKSLLQQAVKTIKLKDSQIELKDSLIKAKDGQIDSLIMALNKKSDMNDSIENKRDIPLHLEETESDEDKNIADIVSRYKTKLEEANKLLQESFSLVKSNEIQNLQLEEQLAAKTFEHDLQIKSYESKIKELENKIRIEGEDSKEEKPTQVEIFFALHKPQVFQIENKISGSGWLIITQFKMDNGSWTKKIIVPSKFVYDIVKDQPTEFYIHIVRADGTVHYAHYKNFCCYYKVSNDYRDDNYRIRSMELLNSSMKIYGSFEGRTFKDIAESFNHNCVFYQLMIRKMQNEN
ncbi:uncharacterized protein LOC111519595 [Drosophila willistoni]|uniref:uncharacterized protein LOC111519595 n=1 Tax=Drosophila willistoni TaxID=7260 RepID=UPI001F086C58|nr:uncharacterized protein LOC111519595 [Drosophila willistoni]